MLTDLKVLSLACKYVFYRPEHNAKERPHWGEFWRFGNVKMKNTNKAQRADEKDGVICLVIIFTPRVMASKMPKMDHFLYFLLLKAKD